MSNCAVVIMAAGEGTRMKSKTSKVLHKICGKSMLKWVADAAVDATGAKPVIIVGDNARAVEDEFGKSCEYAPQLQRLGSGHAVMMATEQLKRSRCEYTLVLAGDMPLVRSEQLHVLIQTAMQGEYHSLMLTTKMHDPTGYGRIIRDGSGVRGIVEQKDASATQKLIKEVNLSLYCFNTNSLVTALGEITRDNAQGEYYITDCIGYIHGLGLKSDAIVTDVGQDCMGINDRVQLETATGLMRNRINTTHMRNGVTLIDSANTYIDADVRIGRDTVIYPGAVIEGKTIIDEDVIIRGTTRIADSVVSKGARIESSVLTEARVGAKTTVGPNAYLRPKSVIGANCKIGDFVEIKNAQIGDGAKASHLAYIGDARVGKDVNIGCGVVFVNYDGKGKGQTIVGDRAFIGSNSNLVAPVNVDAGAYIAAGSTLTKDVPADALVIARAREVIKAGWGKGRYKD